MKLYKRRDFTNVDYLMLSGRHQLLFEENRFENIKAILNWLDSEKATCVESINAVEEEPVTEVISSPIQEVEEELNIDIIENEDKNNKKEIEKIQNNIYDFQEAEDDLLIKTDKN